MEDHGYHSLGKYSSARDDILHFLCMSDWAEESSGNSESPSGYFWKISNAPGDVNLHNGEFNSIIEEWFKENPEVVDSSNLRFELVGDFIVQGVDSGMIYVYSYESKAEMLEAYEALEEQFSAWDEQDEERICPRHGGPWGDDETCPNCTNLDGTPKP